MPGSSRTFNTKTNTPQHRSIHPEVKINLHEFFQSSGGKWDARILDHHENKLRKDIGMLWRTWSFGNLNKKLERGTR